MRRSTSLSCLLIVFLWSAQAQALDYLEHLWFTDDGCRRAQHALALEVGGDPELIAPYLALALVCPAQWDGPYCDDGDKMAQGGLNRLKKGSRGYSATLGDYSALGDHISRQGPIRNLPRAGKDGLVRDTLEWLTDKPGGIDGPIGDVAEDACETKGKSDLPRASRDIDQELTKWWESGTLPSTPAEQLVAAARSPLEQGPHDPAMKYSYDNPHYLDMVLRNHHHFGEAAHGTWNGYHGAATQMRRKTCKDLIVVDADEAEDLADHVAGYENVDWDTIPGDQLASRVCGMLGEVIRGRVQTWAGRGPAELVRPVRGPIEALATGTLDQTAVLDAIVVNMLSLVFEGTGIHYLQDGLAGGHMRTIRSREALVEVRHDHDADNRDGVAAAATTANGTTTFVAWGDGYLLGKSPSPRCDPNSTKPNDVATCLLAKQRGMISLATLASLLDWAHGGPIYAGLDCDAGLEKAVCIGLPVSAPEIASALDLSESFDLLLPGSLPVPPPAFSYESLAVGLGYAPYSRKPYLWTRFGAYSELGMPAHWLTSWEIRLESDIRTGFMADIGYGFHYRLWARAVLDFTPVIFAGLSDLENRPDFFAGIGPRFGFNFLPEGWLTIPMEFSFHIDHPLIFLQTGKPAFSQLGDSRPRGAIGFGLAFMH